MLHFFKKTPKTWIDQPVIDFLMGINPLFVIYYTVRRAGKDIDLVFRDKNGKFIADIYDRDVHAISISYQGSPRHFIYYVNKRLSTEELPSLKDFIEKKTKDYAASQSPLTIGQLSDIQGEFKRRLESTLGIQGVELFPKNKLDTSVDNNIHIYFNQLDSEQRDRFIRFLNRLDKRCIPIEINLFINESTEEEMGATQTELDMLDIISHHKKN